MVNKPKRICIVGGGGAGLAAAWALTRSGHDVHVYDLADRLGGHVNTQAFLSPLSGEKIQVDTGVVCGNYVTYSNFLAFCKHYEIEVKPTKNSLSISERFGSTEFSASSVSAFFVQPGSIFKLSRWRLMFDMFRFNQFAVDLLEEEPATAMEKSIGQYLEDEGYSSEFRDQYLVPFTSAVWCMNPEQVLLDFPVKHLIRILWNNRLLHPYSGSPPWFTVNGGFNRYVAAIAKVIPGDKIHLATCVSSVTAERDGLVTITTESGNRSTFDNVILAVSAPQALGLLGASATKLERDILSSFETKPNKVCLHSDASLMPRDRRVWSAWNYLFTGVKAEQSAVTYDMNILQHHDRAKHGDVFVTLNPPEDLDEATVQGSWTYSHPQYTTTAVEAQKRLPEIQNIRNIQYIGAWQRYGLHEDAFSSGLEAALRLGAELPWKYTTSVRELQPNKTWSEIAVRFMCTVVQFLLLAAMHIWGMLYLSDSDVRELENEENDKPLYDWPNDEGFTVHHEERTPISLEVKGSIPSYASGTLFRNGPGGNQVDLPSIKKFEMSHWFDGFAQVHRFQLLPSASDPARIEQVLYNSRFTCDTIIDSVRRTGSLSGITFGQQRDPCRSVFGKVMSTFTSTASYLTSATNTVSESAPSDKNVNVTLSSDLPGFSQDLDKADSSLPTLHSKTDAGYLQRLDPTTLEPMGVAWQSELHPELTGPLSASHAKSDPISGDIFNYNLTLGPTPTYRVFRTSNSTGKTTVLATIAGPGVRAAYIHSIFLTQTYVILCVYPSYFTLGGAGILWTENMIEAFSRWDSNAKTKWYVVDRRGPGSLVATYESEAFFAFHSVNAWEYNGDILCDVMAYPNTDVLSRLYYKNLLSTAPGAKKYTGNTALAISTKSYLTRWQLKDASNHNSGRINANPAAIRPATRLWQACDRSVELPVINPAYATHRHRYVYGITLWNQSSLSDGIIKIDTENLHHEPVVWSVHGHSPGEPIFIPNPDGRRDEDDGVLLSVVLDGEAKTSYLLCLRAQDLKELGRAECSCAVGFGFHGLHVPSSEKRHQPRPVDF